LLDLDVFERCRFRLCFDAGLVECDFFAAAAGSVGATATPALPALEVGAGTAAGLLRAPSGAAGGGFAALAVRGRAGGAPCAGSADAAGAAGAAVRAAGVTGGAGGVDDALGRPGHSAFENGTFGHDRHANPPAIATLPTTTRAPTLPQDTRRRLRPASGAKSSDRSTLPPHQLSSGVLWRGCAAPAACGGRGCTGRPGEISRI